MKRIFILMLFVGMQITAMQAKEIQRPNSYNYSRGVEAAQNEESEVALDYLNREISDNPKNGYAYCWIAAVRGGNNEYGKALTAINYSIKYLPKGDKYYRGWAYKIKAIIEAAMEDTIAAIADYTEAIKIDPSVYDYYEQRADLYFETSQFELSNKDYQHMIEMEPGNTMGYMGYGRNLLRTDKIDEAIDIFSKVIKMEPDYSSGYSFRAECLINQKKYEQAMTDLIKAIELDGDRKAIYQLVDIEDDAQETAIVCLEIQRTKYPTTPEWFIYSAYFYENHKQYKKAIEMYKRCKKMDADIRYDEQIANCYCELGDWNNALYYYQICNDADSTNAEYIRAMGDVYNEMDSVSLAVSYASKVIEQYPDMGYLYYRRGWYYDNAGQIDEAINDYTKAILLTPEYAYAYVSRGKLYDIQGKHEKALADFNKVIELEPYPVENACAEYAYLHSGDTTKAISFMNEVLAKYPDNTYDAACLYSLIGDTLISLNYLRESLEHGFRRFAHLMKDDDLVNVRKTIGFKMLYDEFVNKYQQEELESIEQNQTEEITYEIPFNSANGVTKVDCTINDLPLNFIFDTGASDVSISMVEANFMLKNGYLTSKDVVGKQLYQTADGNISEGTIINLRKINFGGCELTNIRASVVKNQRAPLLLGQSVLQRIGKIEIDNENRIIKITSK